MYLSKFQKEIVRKISNEEIKTVIDFLLIFKLVLSNVTPKKSVKVGDTSIEEGEADFFVDSIHYKILNRHETYTKLIDFRKVINLLSKEELIDISLLSNITFGYVAYTNYANDIINLLYSSRNTFIVIYNEIKKFEKNFLTPQERNQRRQLWIPIIVAIATVILSAIINYFIYTKEREVFIKNVNAFQDTVKVKIIDKSDTTKKSIE
ncbi:MAG: hypothetical protein FJ213_11690 [Ignavibacteria bacterium]|nr:hypothetical protein [Ignavibacteria bacterium]